MVAVLFALDEKVPASSHVWLVGFAGPVISALLGAGCVFEGPPSRQPSVAWARREFVVCGVVLLAAALSSLFGLPAARPKRVMNLLFYSSIWGALGGALSCIAPVVRRPARPRSTR
jgi:hypothetical protein